MRTLLLLRGVPGSGKSTWVREHHLEAYTLCADDYRLRVQAPVLNEKGVLEISQHNEVKVWAQLHADLENRMKRGDFTIIDATHCNPSYNRTYKKLAEKFRYSVFCLDFQIPLEQTLEQNRQRDEFRQVPEEVIRKMYAMFISLKPQSYIRKIDDISEIDNFFIDDLDGRYDRVKVIGDVHGCYTCLKEALLDEASGDICGDERTKYVFVGDMLERGPENEEVMDYVISHYNKPNVTFVTGNHDEYVMNWIDDSWEVDRKGRKMVPRGFQKMIDKVTEGKNQNEVDALRAKLNPAFRKFMQCYAFSFGGKKYLVTHAGISAVPKLTYIPTVQMVRGVGEYDADIDEMYARSYKEGRCQDFIQIHGHRLNAMLDPEKYDGNEYSVSLEGRIEIGGFLKAFCIDRDGSYMERYRNNVFDPDAGYSGSSGDDHVVTDIQTADPVTNQIIADKYTRVKDLGNHDLISINFTSQAFSRRHWNQNTMKARGLFVDKYSGEIRLRSYNKFFNLDEMEITRKSYLESHLKYPLHVYRKQNGFLGIMSVVDGDIILASKSTNNGPFAEMFAGIFYTLNEKEIEALKKAAVDYNCSFTFEVCHVDDRHIIDFDRNHLWLLDAIPNSYSFNGADIDEEFSDKVKETIPIISGVMQKKALLFTADSLQQVIDYEEAHRDDRDIEGVVCQDRDGFMFKLKFHYYKAVKHLRSLLQYAQKNFETGIDWDRIKEGQDRDFISYFAGRPYDDWKELHIIDAVKEYEKDCGALKL
ncbi:MAG: AAA family ATPase [Lachnospiraceae bacterium]|nr:AAA family ATPase [Lachnospiraceae bacterium]